MYYIIFYRFIIIVKGDEIVYYSSRIWFMINTISENVVGESKISAFQQLDTDSIIKRVKLYSYSNSGWKMEQCKYSW